MDEYVKNILNSWNMGHLIETFEEEDVDKDAFDCLNDRIIDLLIPKLGRRAKFIKKYEEYLQSPKNTTVVVPDPEIQESKQLKPPVLEDEVRPSCSKINDTLVLSTEPMKSDDEVSPGKVYLTEFTKFVSQKMCEMHSEKTHPANDNKRDLTATRDENDEEPEPEEERPQKRRKVEEPKQEFVVPDMTEEYLVENEDFTYVEMDNIVQSDQEMETEDVKTVISISEQAEQLIKVISTFPVTNDWVGLDWLNPKQRNLLSAIIVKYLMTKGCGTISVEDFVYWSKAIEDLFPEESSAMYFRHLGQGPKMRRGGKLYNRYKNILRKHPNIPWEKIDHCIVGDLSEDDFKDIPYEEKDFCDVPEEQQRDRLIQVLRSYDATSSLVESEELDGKKRTALVAALVHYLMTNNDNIITISDLKYWSKAIVILFPTENPETYYRINPNYKKPCGKIYDRYSNVRRRKNISKRNTSKISISKMSELKKITDIDDYTKSLWNETYEERHEMLKKILIQTYMNMFSFLKQMNGYELLTEDFRRMHTNSVDDFTTNWPNYAKKIITSVEENMKSCTENVELPLAGYEDDIETSAMFMLPLLFVYPLKHRSFKGWNPTKQEVLDNFILYATSFKSAVELMYKRRKCLSAHNLQILPVVIACGESISQIKTAHVAINDVCYKFPSLIEAVASAVQIYIALDVGYCKSTGFPWAFIQKFVMKIEHPNHGIFSNKIYQLQDILDKKGKEDE